MKIFLSSGVTMVSILQYRLISLKIGFTHSTVRKMSRIIILAITLCLVEISFTQGDNLQWWNPAEGKLPVISNQAWTKEVQSIYHRLPARAKENVRQAVWNLSKQSAGLSLRFRTNADTIHIRYRIKGMIDFPHMPATGVSGIDLYRTSDNGNWQRCWGSYSIKENSKYTFIIDDASDSYMHKAGDYQLYLPLYNEVEHLEIGVDKKFLFEALPLINKKPIAAYGTSICQGACASRPGMAWTNILERKLARPVINLGFSGNGRLEPELIKLISEIDAEIYILDCLPNLRPDLHDTYQLTIDAVKQLRKKRPGVPIILTEHVGYADDGTNQKSLDIYIRLNIELEKAFDSLKTEGFSNIFYLSRKDLGLRVDSFVDKIHPTDLGMQEYARAYEQLIRKIWNTQMAVQKTDKEGQAHPPCNVENIPHYTSFKINTPIRIDGKLDEAVWGDAPKSERFRDLISGRGTIHDTRAAVLWDDVHLYVGYWIEEPNLQASLTERDAPIYTNNDVELFIAGEDAYYEFEINTYGTIYEVLFIWEEAYKSKGYNKKSEFDRDAEGVRPFNGVGYKNHPKGKRIGFWNWDYPGLQSAVHVDGTINDDSDRDRGWSVELAIPWAGMNSFLGENVQIPPNNSDVRRMDFSRFNQYKEAPPASDSGGWAWSPHGVWDSHVPECFTFIHFSEVIIPGE